MQSYTGSAAVYDLFMDNLPYKEWADYVQKLLPCFNIKEGLVLELGDRQSSVSATV